MKKSGSQSLKFPSELLIGGKLVSGEGAAEAVLNPATGQKLCVVNEASAEQVSAAVQAAESAWESWSQTTPAERSGMLLKIGRAHV